MRKIISILLCLFVVLITGTCVLKTSNEQILKYGDLEKKYASAFSIPYDESICKPDILFSSLSKTAKDTSATIVRTTLLNGKKKNSYEVVKYVLCGTRKSNYMQAFDLQAGKMLSISDTQDIDSDKYVSTIDSDDKNQIGLIQNDMIHMNVVLRPLGQQFAYYKADGLYYVYLKKGMTEETFLKVLSNNIYDISGVTMDTRKMQGVQSKIGTPYVDLTYNMILIGIVFLFLLLFICYFLLQEKKSITIMQLMGIQRKVIIIYYLKDIMWIGPIFFILCALGFRALQNDFHFLYYAIPFVTSIYVLTICVYVLIFHIIQKDIFRVFALKGEKFTKEILKLQWIAEIICFFMAFYVGADVFVNVMEVYSQKQIYHNWEVGADYGIFYPLYIGNEQTDAEELVRDVAINKDLYHVLNKEGALYIDAMNHEEVNLHQYADKKMKIYQTPIIVNPNYLKVFPIKDVNGKNIVISESRKDVILLVPNMYKKYKKAIIDTYKENQKSWVETDENVYGMNTNALSNQKIDIIWTKNGQKMFTFNPDVSMEKKGIKSAVIEIITENNSYICQRNSILGNGNSDPLKVKLNGDSKNTYAKLLPTLKQLNLSDNLKAIVSINEQAQETLTILNSRLKLSLEIMVGLIVAIILLSYQTTALVFDSNKKDYVVKECFGISWKRIYAGYLIQKTVTVVAVGVFYGIFINYGGYIYMTIAVCAVLLIQFCIIYMCMIHQQKKKKTDILKGK